uniref:F-box associated beta-propeller type 1 domain-containing protein n=1 Tax=Quercus lobata TaxID=97700 RepID=A0A7N2L6Q6_QUELO
MLSCDLPEDLVVEILSSLPVKFLMQFKDTRVSLLSNDTLEVSSNIDLSPFFLEEIDMLVIDGPCNGIFFLYGISSERYYGEEIVLWNPATRESKVVRIVDFRRCKPLQFEVYNLSTDSWRVIDGSVNQLYGIEFAMFPSYLNGFYHWMASEYPNITMSSRIRCFMISFDMSNEDFQETLLPPIIKDPFSTDEIAIINDSVSLIVEYFDVYIRWYDIWVMRETAVERTWTKKFKICLHPIFDKMLEFREDGLVLFQDSDGWLVVNDRKTQEVRNIAKYEISDLSHSIAVSYTETLVFLNEGNVIE